MKLNIYKLLSLLFYLSNQVIQSQTQGVATTKTTTTTNTTAQNGITITDEQLKSFSYGSEEFTMAIIGDSGAERESREVMKLTSYNALLHLGDYDYECEPNKYFDTTLDSNRSYQFMGIIGNHEGVSECGKEKFEKYKSLLYNQMTNSKNSKVKCEFSSSKAMWVCIYKNVRIIGLSSDINGADKRDEQLSFLKKHLGSATEDWKICSWHYYDKYYHTGKYPEDSERNVVSGDGESFYDYCKDHGAIIFSAHDHVYARTHVMSKFKSPEIDTYDKSTDENIVQIRNGATLNILNGAGGYEMYVEDGKEKDYSHWQKKYAKGKSGENAKKFGGLFCNFNYGGNPKKAYCQFLRINSSDKVFDSFTIYQNENPGTVKYSQIDTNFKNEKIKAYKIAHNIVDPAPSTTTMINSMILNATPSALPSTPTVPDNNNDSYLNVNPTTDQQKENSKAKENSLFSSRNLKIGGSICAALVVLSGGILIFNKRSKKAEVEPEPKLKDTRQMKNIAKEDPSDNFINIDYNFSNSPPFGKNNGIDNSFAPLPISGNSRFYQNNNNNDGGGSGNKNDYYNNDRNYDKMYMAYSTSDPKQYNYYTKTSESMNNDTEPLVNHTKDRSFKEERSESSSFNIQNYHLFNNRYNKNSMLFEQRMEMDCPSGSGQRYDDPNRNTNSRSMGTSTRYGEGYGRSRSNSRPRRYNDDDEGYRPNPGQNQNRREYDRRERERRDDLGRSQSRDYGRKNSMDTPRPTNNYDTSSYHYNKYQ